LIYHRFVTNPSFIAHVEIHDVTPWGILEYADTLEARIGDYDFGVTVIRHQNADAMVLASALMRGIHPPDNI
jgi:hypothetical protein